MDPVLAIAVLAGEGRRFVGEPLPSWIVWLAGLAVLVAIVVGGVLVKRRS
ncbi:MAG: hypothetical protein H0U26_09830 [Acidimicrobiia bacterium]|nr:hypothetical protein [Acidimicrobiia bacterium]